MNHTRSKACSSVSRNSSSPVSRRLVVKSKYQPPMSCTDKRTHSGGARSWLCDKLRKIRARTYTKNRLSGLPFRFDTGKSLSNRKEVENSSKSCSGHGGRITNHSKALNREVAQKVFNSVSTILNVVTWADCVFFVIL